MKRILLATTLAAATLAGSIGAASAHEMLIYGENANGQQTVQLYNETPTAAPAVTRSAVKMPATGGTHMLIVENNRNGADSHVFS